MIRCTLPCEKARARARRALAYVRRAYVDATGHTPAIALATTLAKWAEHEQEIQRREAELRSEMEENR